MGCCFSQPDSPTDLQEPTQVTALTTENNNVTNHSPTSVPQYNEQEYIDRKDTIQLPTTSTSIESANEKNNHSEVLLTKEENEKEKSSTSSLQPAINVENNDHHQENEKEEKESKIESNLIPPIASMPISSSSSTSSSLTWPIAIRLSSLSSKDILFDLPIEEPFWTIKDLKQQLIPHIESLSSTTSSSTTNNNTSLKKSSSFKMKLSSSISSTLSSSSSSSPHLRIVFIRLGKILDDDLIVIPSSVQKESNSGNVLILEKEGVIQAMVSKTS